MGFKKQLYKSKYILPLWETARLAWFKSIGGFMQRPRPVWYKFASACEKEKKEHLAIDQNWFKLNRAFYYKEEITYNIDNAIKAKPDLKGIALVFFMNMKDYLYATPFISALAKKYPKLKIHALTAKEFNKNIVRLMESNPVISKTTVFDGFPNTSVPNNYDYAAALPEIEPGFLIMPVIPAPNAPHKALSLYKTFSLAQPKTAPEPLFYFPAQPKTQTEDAFKKIRRVAAKKKAVVFLHMDTKEFDYLYPHRDNLVRGLIRDGYFVISASQSAVLDEAFYKINNDKMPFNEAVHLLALLKEIAPVYMISLNSIFWPVSAALDIPNLGLQIFEDKKMPLGWYPNITVVTNREYEELPKNKMHLAWPENYTKTRKKLLNYNNDFVLKCFYKLIAKK